jgi:hypothetical protein
MNQTEIEQLIEDQSKAYLKASAKYGVGSQERSVVKATKFGRPTLSNDGGYHTAEVARRYSCMDRNEASALMSYEEQEI